MFRYVNNIVFIFKSFGRAEGHVGSWFTSQELNLGPLQGKNGVLTTGPPGSLTFFIFKREEKREEENTTLEFKMFFNLENSLP